jgi:hypothetical protein
VVVMLGSAMASLVGWFVVHAAMARVADIPVEAHFETSVLSVDEVVEQLLAMVTPLSRGQPVSIIGGPWLTELASTVGALIVAACFWPLLSGTLNQRRELLAGAAGLTMILGGVVSFLANYALLGVGIDVSPRYGLSLVPALGLALASAIRWRVAFWAITAFALVVVGSTLVALGSAL